MKHYDAVVVGGRAAAVASAALLAKRGVRTLLIDQGELASIDHHLLPDLIPSDEGSPVMERVHSELGVRDEVRGKSQALSPLLQVILPDQRIDLSADRAESERQTRRALGAAADRLTSMWSSIEEAESETGDYLAELGELPATGFFGRRTATKVARKHPRLGESTVAMLEGTPRDVAEMALALLPFLTHLDCRRPSEATVARFARPVGRFLRGMSSLGSGRGLRALLLAVAERKSCEVRRSAVESVEPKGKMLELVVAGHRDPVNTELLIDASADLSGLDTLRLTRQKKDFASMLQNAKPKGFLHVLGIEVDLQVLPPGLADHALLLNGRRDPTRFDAQDPDAEDRPMWLTVRPAERDAQRRQLVLAHPVSSVRAHAQGFDMLEEIMRRRAERLIPFLMDGRPEIHPLSGRGATQRERSVLSHPHYAADLDPLVGVTGVPMRTPFKNVFVAGPAVLPGLGVEGEYLSAVQAVDAAEKLLKKRKS